MSAPYISISKLDAGKRQLETAIKIFLTNGDPVSIHNLSSAAQEIFNDLLKKQGLGASFIEDATKKFVKPEKQKELSDKFREPQNFFKHADRDPDSVFKFYFEATPWTIWDTCNMYKTLTGEVSLMVAVFLIWFYSKYPEFLFDNSGKESLQSLAKQLGLSPENRSKFLDLIPDLIRLQNRN